MLQLLPYFLFVFVLTYVYGLIPFVLLKKTLPINPVIPVLVGYGVLGLLSQWFMIGGAIDGFVILITLLGALVAVWRYKPVYTLHFVELLSWFKYENNIQQIPGWPKLKFNFFLWGVLLVILYQSALPTKINDMGAYYLQTLQWMREYGAIKGLGNLYPALGLGSAWHSLVVLLGDGLIHLGGENEPGLRFLAINGTILFTFFLYLLNEFKREFNWYCAACTILIIPFGFLYLTAPSPDLPLILFTALIVYYTFIKPNEIPASILILLACFVFACKPPAFISIGCTLVVFIQSFYLTFISSSSSLVIRVSKASYQTVRFLLLALLCLTPVIVKNVIQTGYPIYPSQISMPYSTPQPPWQIPTDLNTGYRKGIQTFGLNDRMEKGIYTEPLPTGKSRLAIWLKRSGYKGFMNRLIALNFLFSIFLLFFKILPKNKLILLGVLLIQLIEWYTLSQYRLLMPSAITLFSLNVFFCSFLFSGNLYNSVFTESWFKKFAFLSIRIRDQFKHRFSHLLFAIYLVFAFLPLSMFKSSSRNQDITQSGGFNAHYLITPYQTYRNGVLATYQVDSIPFHFYNDRTFIWDCPIPAVSKSHQQFLYETYGYRLHALGVKVSDGFYLSKE